MRLTGFEPAAFRVGAERSIQLSYNRTYMEKHRRDVFRLKNLWSVHRQTAGGICAADRQRRNLLCRFVLPRRAWSTQYDAFSGRMRLCRADGPPVSFIITHPAQKINRILQKVPGKKVPGSRASGADGPRRVPFARWGPYASRLGGKRFGRTGAGPGAFRPPPLRKAGGPAGEAAPAAASIGARRQPRGRAEPFGPPVQKQHGCLCRHIDACGADGAGPAAAGAPRQGCGLSPALRVISVWAAAFWRGRQVCFPARPLRAPCRSAPPRLFRGTPAGRRHSDKSCCGSFRSRRRLPRT